MSVWGQERLHGLFIRHVYQPPAAASHGGRQHVKRVEAHRAEQPAEHVMRGNGEGEDRLGPRAGLKLCTEWRQFAAQTCMQRTWIRVRMYTFLPSTMRRNRDASHLPSTMTLSGGAWPLGVERPAVLRGWAARHAKRGASASAALAVLKASPRAERCGTRERDRG